MRPFARLSPFDLLLYQSLVDFLARDIEAALPSRDVLFSYRLDLTGSDDPFFGTPRWDDFVEAVRADLESGVFTHALRLDISSYFVHIDIDELERQLLGVCDDALVVRDLADLLRAFGAEGVRGLPQGAPPSSALGNFYLCPVDAWLLENGVVYRRYMDDFWIFATSYAEARRIQDEIERLLYLDRLSLGGEKSRIYRASTAIALTETAQERIDARREAVHATHKSQVAEAIGILGDYADLDEIEIPEGEIDNVAIHGEYDEIRRGLEQGEYPHEARSRLTEVYRQLEKGRDPYALPGIADFLERLPDLTWSAVRYAASLGSESREQVEDMFLELTAPSRFHKEHEWLHLCRAGLLLRWQSPKLASRFGEIAMTSDTSPLVRARALLAWGKLSAPDDFSSADQFWAAAGREWRHYVFVSIQGKSPEGRDRRFANWSAEGGYLRRLADELQQRMIAWREI